MTTRIQAVRGMNDILPQQVVAWQKLEAVLRQLASRYSYSEVRFPVVELAQLFKRAIGDVTDIVEKEMYTFTDLNGDMLSLRPEGTASCMRMGLEHGLFYNQVQRFYYMGPMFRHERPQKGRYRQFHQFSLEAFGMAGPEIDAELILFTASLWQQLGLTDSMSLELNSLASLPARQAYKSKLVEYFSDYATQLDADSQRRLHSNPLRILDSKNPAMQSLIAAAPSLLEHLDAESQLHFEGVCACLDAAGVSYRINPRLVRGLDYYNRTVFEWITTQLGTQGTVCAGGRYDGLAEQLGGKPTLAVGFAMGLERLLALMESNTTAVVSTTDLYIVAMDVAATRQAVVLAEILRRHIPALRVQTDCTGSNIKTQLKRADKAGATYAVLVAAESLTTQELNVKFLRTTQEPQNFSLQRLLEYIGCDANIEGDGP